VISRRQGLDCLPSDPRAEARFQATWYRSLALVVAVRSWPVAVLRALIDTPGSAPAVSSVTTPAMLPGSSWASAKQGTRRSPIEWRRQRANFRERAAHPPYVLPKAESVTVRSSERYRGSDEPRQIARLERLNFRGAIPSGKRQRATDSVLAAFGVIAKRAESTTHLASPDSLVWIGQRRNHSTDEKVTASASTDLGFMEVGVMLVS
jgi:hypothetical protein